MQTVDLGPHGIAEFPDDLTPEQMQAAIAQIIPPPKFDPVKPFTVEGAPKGPDIFDRLTGTNAQPVFTGDIFDRLAVAKQSAPAIPPIPEGFQLDSRVIPPLPDGFVLDRPNAAPPSINQEAAMLRPQRNLRSMTSTIAGGPPVSLEGNPFDIAGQAIVDAALAIPRGLGVIGKLGAASVADLAQAAEYPEGGSNLQAFIENKPLPIEEATD